MSSLFIKFVKMLHCMSFGRKHFGRNEDLYCLSGSCLRQMLICRSCMGERRHVGVFQKFEVNHFSKRHNSLVSKGFPLGALLKGDKRVTVTVHEGT